MTQAQPYGNFQKQWDKHQRRAASTAEREQRAAIVARNKRSAASKPGSDNPFGLPWGKGEIKASNESAIKAGVLDRRDLGPTRGWLQRTLDSLGDVVGKGADGASQALKWGAIGAIALGVLVIVPRLLPK